MSKMIDETGNRYGRLLVLARAANTENGKAAWLCLCDCGQRQIAHGKHLRRGAVRSCGCLVKDCNTTHGCSHLPEYDSWKAMIRRCYDASANSFQYYGKRGIKVCREWRNDPGRFCEDIGPRPEPGYSLDRIDNDGDYTPENCRWATRIQQNRNRNQNHVLSYNGQTLCVAAWAEKLGIKPTTLYQRIYKGWSVRRALTTPVRGQSKPSHA